MSLKPCNRHLLVQIVKQPEQEKQSSILVPDDYEIKAIHAKVLLEAISDDCTLDLKIGNKLLVNNTMLEKIIIDEDTYYLILENYVLGVLG